MFGRTIRIGRSGTAPETIAHEENGGVNGIHDRRLPARGGPAPRLFTARLDDVGPDELDRLAATLDAAERRRRDAVLQDLARRVFELSHGLMRHAVATHLGVALDAVRLRVGIGEKPMLLAPPADLDLSLTHSGDFAACAVLARGLVGVDAEQPRPGRAPCLEGVLAPEEQAWLAAREALPDGSLMVWTIKEAVAKALGLGLRLGFDGFAVLPDPPRVIRAPAGHPGPWRLWQEDIGRTTVAVAWSPVA